MEEEEVGFPEWPSRIKRLPVERRCSYALRFATWCDQLFATWIEDLPAGEEGTARINQALFHLQDGYFQHRAHAPAEHLDTLGDEDHICLYRVYVEAFERLKDLQLRRLPPPVVVKRAPKPKAPVVAQGLYLGDEDVPPG